MLVAILFSGYLVSNKPVPQKDNEKRNHRFVKTEKVEYQESSGTMTYRGRVTAFDNISLGAEVQGKIMQGDVRFKAGESFQKGDVLINIYKEDVEASLKSGKSSFLQTLSKILPDLKVDYPDDYTKWNEFFKTLDVDKPLPPLPETASEAEKVFLAANNVLSSYYSLQQQEINLQRYTIIAPFNGSFKTVNKEIGAIASPGVELAGIVRTDILEIIVPVFPDDLQWIHKGKTVKITSHNGDVKTARVSRIADFVDETTQSVNVYLSYHAGNTNDFLQGEYVDVEFEGASSSGFEIPRESLVKENTVYELKDSKLVETEIEILRKLPDSYLISGIEAGKIVVTESLTEVNPSLEYLPR